MFESLGDLGESLKNPEASGWINALNQVAASIEHTAARSDYGLEAIWHAEGNAVELYGLFRKVRKRLLGDLKNSAPRLHEALQQADIRMKAARDAAREAYEVRREQAIREAERDTGNVIPMFDEQRKERNAREQYADTGA